MATVAALVPDLLFGSKVQAMLAGAGHEVELLQDEVNARARAPEVDVLVLDLTTDAVDGVTLVESMHAGAELPPTTRTLAFYSHVEPEVRARALEAGIDLVVPRSRFAREGAELVASLLSA